jgi:hypothetical protein
MVAAKNQPEPVHRWELLQPPTRALDDYLKEEDDEPA